MFNQFYYPFFEREGVSQIILIMVLVMQSFLKILFFMKIFEDYGFLVQMIFLSIMDLGPFLAFFSLWVLFFVIEFKVLKMEYEPDDY